MAEYSDQVKALALAQLLAGLAPSDVARSTGIPVGTLRSWKSRQQHGESVATVATESRERIGALLSTYLEVTLTTLIAQQKAFANVEWLLKQSAAEAATLHGVSVDKAVRLLEALADQSDPSELS